MPSARSYNRNIRLALVFVMVFYVLYYNRSHRVVEESHKVYKPSTPPPIPPKPKPDDTLLEHPKIMSEEKFKKLKNGSLATKVDEILGNEAWDPKAKVQAEKIKEMMLHAWNGYLKYAKGFDELDSTYKKGYNWYPPYSLLLTPIDAYDTLLLMGLKKEAAEAKELLLGKLNFDIPVRVSLFETNIRVLGGLLSAYEIDGDKNWIRLATGIADKLLPAFETASGLPVDAIDLDTGKIQANGARGMLSQVGSLQLEFQYLSDITGKPIYAQKALKALDILHSMKRPIKGILPIYFDIDTATFKTPYEYGISAGGDSFYEYLLKLSLVTGDEKYWKMYNQFTEDLETNLVKFSTDKKRAWSTTPETSNDNFHHLSCFSGGMLALGDFAKRNDTKGKIFELGKKITHTCHDSYEKSSTGLGGEFVSGENAKPRSESFALRPETIESIFYMWRLTKDEIYRDWGRKIIESIEDNCRDENGYHPLQHSPNVQMSFFLAETLKYLYLLFTNDDVVPLDKFVFNTEGHVLSKRGFGKRSTVMRSKQA